MKLTEENRRYRPEYGIKRNGQHHAHDAVQFCTHQNDDKNLQWVGENTAGKNIGLDNIIIEHLSSAKYGDHLYDLGQHLRVKNPVQGRTKW